MSPAPAAGDAGDELLIAGCSAPEILKLVHAINESGGQRFTIAGFLDIDEERIRTGFRGLPVWDERRITAADFPGALVAVNVAGTMELRWRVVSGLTARGFRRFPALIHPGVDTFGVTVGEGVTVFHGVELGIDVTIGRFSLVLMGALVNHEASIGECSFLGPGSIVLGRAAVGVRVYVGAGAVIFPGVTVGDGAVVGAGAVVREDVPAGGTVAGVPARALARRGRGAAGVPAGGDGRSD